MIFDNKAAMWQSVNRKEDWVKRKIVLRVLFLIVGIPGSLFLLGGNQGIVTAGIILAIVLLPDGTDD
ncbi:MAG: hypothetical protein V1905_00040 [bacterium]